MKEFIFFYKNVNEIKDENAFSAIINYSGYNKEEFLRHIYIQIGIPGDSENFDALYDDYRNFYWINNKSKIFLIHESLPQNKDIVITYLEILFSSIHSHKKNPYRYYGETDEKRHLYVKENLYGFFKITDRTFIEKMLKKYLKSEDYLLIGKEESN